jgi:hypothetical protein
MLGEVRPRRGPDGAVEHVYELDARTHRYLEDHRLDEKPVLPAAVALELMAELAQNSRPDLEVVGVRDLRVLKGVIVDDGPRQVRLVASPRPPGASDVAEVEVAITEPDAAVRRHYAAVVELAAHLPAPESHSSVLRPGSGTAAGLSAAEAYRQYLFHGPRFRCITEIEWADESGIVGLLRPSAPADCLGGAVARPWLIDPVVLDGGPQLAIIWSRLHRDMTPLPAGIGEYRRFGPLGPGPVRCSLRVLPESTAEMLVSDVSYTGEDGQLLGLLRRLELVLSPALNRLVGADR